MDWLVVVCACGLLAGLLLLRRVPILEPDEDSAQQDSAHQDSAHENATSGDSASGHLRVSVIVPARNEEATLPALLASLRVSDTTPAEVIVVNDGSTDATAAVAAEFGATVLTSSRLPAEWTGKNWACQQGAIAAAADVLLFLDADTRFVGDGYRRAAGYFSRLPANAALSILPYHRTERWYEELSFYFNILIAMGAGGFSGLGAPRLFGQSLMLRKDLYLRAGGHRSVRGEVIEGPPFVAQVKAAGGVARTLGGRDALEMRMFPRGAAQMIESWRRGSSAGAGSSSGAVLALSILWLGGSALAAILLVAAPGLSWRLRIACYLLFAVQARRHGRQVGSFCWPTALIYPVPLLFFFVIFGQSGWRRLWKRPAAWKGRAV